LSDGDAPGVLVVGSPATTTTGMGATSSRRNDNWLVG